MESLLLSLHVVAGILFVGPVAVATSLFSRYVPVTATVGGARGDERSIDTAWVLHRITRTYGVLAIAVPVVGLVLASVQGRTSEVWVVGAMVLTAVAGGLLALQITPRQQQALTSPDHGAQLRHLGMVTGLFNLLWVLVVVLMIVRPGSGHV